MSCGTSECGNSGAEGKAVEYEHGTLEPSASSCLPHLLSSVLIYNFHFTMECYCAHPILWFSESDHTIHDVQCKLHSCGIP